MLIFKKRCNTYPIISRKNLPQYIFNKWKRLNGIELLADMIIHAPGFCGRYCVCRVATIADKREYYQIYKKRTLSE